MTVEKINPLHMPDDMKVADFGELALFLGGSTDSWTGDLLRLIAKSDNEHRAALEAAFPVHVAVWTRWQNSRAPKVGELTEVATLASGAG